MKREDMAELLAPSAPPCFDSRSLWVSYLRSAAAAHHVGDAPGPLLFIRGEAAALDADAGLRTAERASVVVPFLIAKGSRVEFNRAFSYCDECHRTYEAQMRAQGRCNPNHLRTA